LPSWFTVTLDVNAHRVALVEREPVPLRLARMTKAPLFRATWSLLSHARAPKIEADAAAASG
jgi:hypothetical protein